MDTKRTVNVYVDEPMLSVAKYEIFVAKGQRGITEKRANALLREDRRKLPCRKLYGFASEQIKKQIMDGNSSGSIVKEGIRLFWKMEGDLSDLNREEKEKVISVALDGDWEQESSPLSYHEALKGTA